MKTYSVKDIADILHTNPETVRRWIRNGKLKAAQISRKTGNIVQEEDFKAFLESKSFENAEQMIGSSVPVNLHLATTLSEGLVMSVASSIVSFTAGIITGYIKTKKEFDIAVTAEELKEYIQMQCDELRQNILVLDQKKEELVAQVNQYESLLKDDDFLYDTIEKEISKSQKRRE